MLFPAAILVAVIAALLAMERGILRPAPLQQLCRQVRRRQRAAVFALIPWLFVLMVDWSPRWPSAARCPRSRRDPARQEAEQRADPGGVGAGASQAQEAGSACRSGGRRGRRSASRRSDAGSWEQGFDLRREPLRHELEPIDGVGVGAQSERDAARGGDDGYPQRVPVGDLGE